MAASLDADRLARDRASRSAFRDEPALPPPDAPPDRPVTVERVETAQFTEERLLPVTEQRRYDDTLPRGETRVEDDGAPGVERVVFLVTKRDGRVTDKRPLSSEIVTPARPRVVVVGRGGGRTVPTDVDKDLPFKLRLPIPGARHPIPAQQRLHRRDLLLPADEAGQLLRQVGGERIGRRRAGARRAGRPGTTTSRGRAPTAPCRRAPW